MAETSGPQFEVAVGALLCPDGTRVFRVSRVIGSGGFGSVYEIVEVPTKAVYAIKSEKAGETALAVEVLVLGALLAAGRTGRACKVHLHGTLSSSNFLVMDLHGKSLQDLRKEGQDQHLSSALRAGRQTLKATEDVHAVGYLHRDIKPGNFAVGREEVNQQRTVFFLDFGLARKFTIASGHRPPRPAAGFVGTERYAPLNCHRSKELGRPCDTPLNRPLREHRGCT